MSPLEQALTDYLQVRRALGYKLRIHGKLLPQFVAYLQGVGAERVTTEHALQWATLPAGISPTWCARRLCVVRGFARYLQSVRPGTEVPPMGLLVGQRQRATPYLYSGREIAALIAAAGTLRFPLRAATYQTLIGLLAVTGLRVGEAHSARRRNPMICASRGSAGLHPRGRPSACSDPASRWRRHVTRCEEYRPSRRNNAPSCPDCVQASASRRISSLYSAVKRLRFGPSTSSGSGTPAGAGRPTAAPLCSPTARSSTRLSAPSFSISNIVSCSVLALRTQ
jgi:integrase